MNTFSSLLEQNRHDIWRYRRFYEEISPEYWLSLEKKFSDLEESKALADFLGIPKLYFKREDFNLAGSHKSRSLAYQVSVAAAGKLKKLVISSSGNAAICAARYCQLAKIPLTVFFSKKRLAFDQAKIAEMQKYGPDLRLVEKPLTAAREFARETGAFSLNPSSDDRSIVGLQSLGFELFEQLPDLKKTDAVFMFVASGSSFLGIFQAWLKLQELGSLKSLPQLYLVQAGDGQAMASFFDKRELEKEPIFGTIGIKKFPRQEAVITAAKKTGGGGLVVAHREIEEMETILDNHSLKTGDESIAAMAGLQRAITVARENKKKLPWQRVVVIFTGRKWVDN